MMVNNDLGYPIECKEIFKYPNLEFVPSLKDKNEISWDKGICNNLSKLLDSGENIGGEVEKLKKKILEKIKSPYIIEFFNRFMVEWQREKNKGNRLKWKLLSEPSKKFAQQGWYNIKISNEELSSLNNLLKRDIEKLNNSPSRKNYRAYDRSISYKNGKVVNLVQSIYSNNKLINIAEEYRGKKFAVKSVVLHISRPDDYHINQVFSDLNYHTRTQMFHTDPKTTVKSLLYIKDVGEEDGPFEFIKNSSQLYRDSLTRLAAKTNCTINYLDSDKARADFMNMPDPLRVHGIFGSMTDDRDPLSQELISNKVSFISPAGGTILFYPSRLIHRGGMPTTGNRTSLQITLD